MTRHKERNGLPSSFNEQEKRTDGFMLSRCNQNQHRRKIHTSKQTALNLLRVRDAVKGENKLRIQ